MNNDLTEQESISKDVPTKKKSSLSVWLFIVAVVVAVVLIIFGAKYYREKIMGTQILPTKYSLTKKVEFACGGQKLSMMVPENYNVKTDRGQQWLWIYNKDIVNPEQISLTSMDKTFYLNCKKNYIDPNKDLNSYGFTSDNSIISNKGNYMLIISKNVQLYQDTKYVSEQNIALPSFFETVDIISGTNMYVLNREVPESDKTYDDNLYDAIIETITIQ